MTSPAARLRVVTLGSSVALMVRPRAYGPHDLTYSRHLERLLNERGSDASVVNEARWFEMIDATYRRWEQAVGAHAPDVVIANFGFVECQPPVLPHRLHRWVLDWNTPLGPVRGRVRRPLVAGAKTAVGWWTPLVCERIGQRLHKRSPQRLSAELSRLIGSTRSELQAAVLVLGLAPPAGQLGFMPGIDERVARYDALLADVVADYGDPQVRFVSVAPVVAKLGAINTTGDGVHFTPDAHRLVAELLADEISGL